MSREPICDGGNLISRQMLHSAPDHVYTMKHEYSWGGGGKGGAPRAFGQSCTILAGIHRRLAQIRKVGSQFTWAPISSLDHHPSTKALLFPFAAPLREVGCAFPQHGAACTVDRRFGTFKNVYTARLGGSHTAQENAP